MVYKIDYVDGDVLRWSVTETGVECEVDESYTPTIYVSVHGDGDFSTARAALRDHPAAVRVAVVDERVSFRHDPERVLQVDVVDLKAVNSVARMVSKWGSPGEYRCYNVDFSREFRYCLEEGIDPLPAHKLSQMQIAVSETELASERVTELTVNDETIAGSGADVLATLSDRVESVDPDVLFLNTSDLIPVLFQQADRLDVEFQLGRRPGWQQLTGKSTYESYGQVGHSPARYNLPGRVIIDGSNTFMWNQTNLDGCLYLVEQSGKPLQELAWSSIGNILTGVQIQEARRRDVLVPWRSWRHEQFKTMCQLHDADRGGFTFAPDVGLHEDVHELDFSSLYPNIIVTRNVSPEKIRCECHADREDVPDIGYSICDDRGYLPDVLEPLIKDRDAIKAEIRETEEEKPARNQVIESTDLVDDSANGENNSKEAGNWHYGIIGIPLILVGAVAGNASALTGLLILLLPIVMYVDIRKVRNVSNWEPRAWLYVISAFLLFFISVPVYLYYRNKTVGL
ncbi:DNA polymerase domain-containing protein [Haladaptatus pallidirubidus]|uniref:DNA-directed DNA polymerase n=1 Tax=Haladaptatus pallidirubidus TaxID=1008152 RepID=A0AAV3UN01_9EURY|nr:DNA polymerase domain-containing protein [Haladaptatus pallidirubidus]